MHIRYLSKPVRFESWMIERPAVFCGLSPCQAETAARETERQYPGDDVVRFLDVVAVYCDTIRGTYPDVARRLDLFTRFRIAGYEGRIQDPILIFIGGTSGSGKDTLAADLKATLGVDREYSTDIVRQEVSRRIVKQYGDRTNVPDELLPLFGATYRADVAGHTLEAGYEVQARCVAEQIPAMIESALREARSVFHPYYLFHGVHIMPHLATYRNAGVFALPVLLAPPYETLKERRLVRAEMEQGPETPDNAEDRIETFERIYRIQQHLEAQAEAASVAIIRASTRSAVLDEFAGRLEALLKETWEP